VKVNRSLEIPEEELSLRFTPSGGPGGQHANRSSTRVELTWNVARSRALRERQKRLIQAHLRSRIDSSGDLRIVSDAHRSQLRNREDARRRLASLVAEALRPRLTRVATTPTAAARDRRLAGKRRRAEIKRLRQAPSDD
jgi:ribosome-associated protein